VCTEADAGDGSQHDVEGAAGRFRFAKKGEWNAQAIVLLPVESARHGLDGTGRRLDLFEGADFNKEPIPTDRKRDVRIHQLIRGLDGTGGFLISNETNDRKREVANGEGFA